MIILIVAFPAVLMTDSPINSTAAPRLVEQPASVTQVPVVQEEQPGLDAVHGAGSVTNLAE